MISAPAAVQASTETTPLFRQTTRTQPRRRKVSWDAWRTGMRSMILRRQSSHHGGSTQVASWEGWRTETSPMQQESPLGAARSGGANASPPRLKARKSSRRPKERR